MADFGNLKNMYSMQKQAKKIKQELKNTHIEADEGGVTVTVDGEMEVISIEISDDIVSNKNKVEGNLVKALNKAIKKSQEVAAKRMQDIMGGMGLPGM